MLTQGAQTDASSTSSQNSGPTPRQAGERHRHQGSDGVVDPPAPDANAVAPEATLQIILASICSRDCADIMAVTLSIHWPPTPTLSCQKLDIDFRSENGRPVVPHQARGAEVLLQQASGPFVRGRSAGGERGAGGGGGGVSTSPRRPLSKTKVCDTIHAPASNRTQRAMPPSRGATGPETPAAHARGAKKHEGECSARPISQKNNARSEKGQPRIRVSVHTCRRTHFLSIFSRAPSYSRFGSNELLPHPRERRCVRRFLPGVGHASGSFLERPPPAC